MSPTPKSKAKPASKSKSKAKPSTKKKQALKFPTILGPTGLPPTFKCGTHEPAHIANSIQEIMELNKQEGCGNFIVISEPII